MNFDESTKNYDESAENIPPMLFTTSANSNDDKPLVSSSTTRNLEVYDPATIMSACNGDKQTAQEYIDEFKEEKANNPWFEYMTFDRFLRSKLNIKTPEKTSSDESPQWLTVDGKVYPNWSDFSDFTDSDDYCDDEREIKYLGARKAFVDEKGIFWLDVSARQALTFTLLPTPDRFDMYCLTDVGKILATPTRPTDYETLGALCVMKLRKTDPVRYQEYIDGKMTSSDITLFQAIWEMENEKIVETMKHKMHVRQQLNETYAKMHTQKLKETADERKHRLLRFVSDEHDTNSEEEKKSRPAYDSDDSDYEEHDSENDENRPECNYSADDELAAEYMLMKADRKNSRSKALVYKHVRKASTSKKNWHPKKFLKS